jgi:hypothetical protein
MSVVRLLLTGVLLAVAVQAITLEPKASFNALDTDSDGQISKEELEAFMIERRRSAHAQITPQTLTDVTYHAVTATTSANATPA